jgi:hypothetical protein
MSAVPRAQTTVFALEKTVTQAETVDLLNTIGDVAFGGACIYYGGRIVLNSGTSLNIKLTDATGFELKAAGVVSASTDLAATSLHQGIKAPVTATCITPVGSPNLTITLIVKK